LGGQVLRFVLGLLLGILVRSWALTWRVRIYKSCEIDFESAEPLVFVFWHGSQMALTAISPRRPTNVLVSLSADGELQSGVMHALGLRVLRGSSSRGGARGLRALIRRLRSGQDAALAVDGPRGPKRSCKLGAILAARLAAGQCVPLGCASSRSVTLHKTWDQFEIPLPFARVAVCMGDAVGGGSDRETSKRVADAIERANACAEAALSRPAAARKESPCQRS
jgi:lysophospholipid acyltransferase (LPLAT)-like uncharacterized protein